MKKTKEQKQEDVISFVCRPDAEIISAHINNLILTYGEETVKNTLKLFIPTTKEIKK